MKHTLVFPDLHAPLHDEPYIRVLLDAIGLVQPERLVCLGDIGEWDSISPWRAKKKKRPPLEYVLPELDKDVAAVNELLDDIDEAAKKAGVKKKQMIIGNHEMWLEHFVEEHPYLSKYRPANAMRLRERGWKWTPNNEIYKLGNLYLYHGNGYSGKYHAANHIAKFGGADMMYGHAHDYQVHSAANVNGTSRAYCIGCGKKMDRDSNQWIGPRAINWSHNFAIVNHFGKSYTVEVVEVVRGHASVWGKELDGNA